MKHKCMKCGAPLANTAPLCDKCLKLLVRIVCVRDAEEAAAALFNEIRPMMMDTHSAIRRIELALNAFAMKQEVSA